MTNAITFADLPADIIEYIQEIADEQACQDHKLLFRPTLDWIEYMGKFHQSLKPVRSFFQNCELCYVIDSESSWDPDDQIIRPAVSANWYKWRKSLTRWNLDHLFRGRTVPIWIEAE